MFNIVIDVEDKNDKTIVVVEARIQSMH